MTVLRWATLASLVITATLRAADPPKGPERWEKTIAAFEEQDKKTPPPENAALFVGSSSIRLWKLGQSFPNEKTINRGFGGSVIADSTHFAPRIVNKYRPRVIVLYAGDNDIAGGKKPEQVAGDFAAFVAAVRKDLPETPIVFLAVKPSLKRWSQYETQTKANALVAEACKKGKNLAYVDTVKPMLGEDGKPRKELFVEDGLHLSAEGYKLWTELVKPHLK